MDLFIFRHAIACPATLDQDDSQRALSTEGRLQFGRMVDCVGRLPVQIQQIYHSPWTRAVQTAEILRAVVPNTPDACVPATELACSPSDGLFDLLHLHSNSENACIALVGHQPWLSTLIAWLVEGDRNTGYRFILDPGGMAWLQGDARTQGMRLRSLMSPTIL